jgi:hypothetical protein
MAWAPVRRMRESFVLGVGALAQSRGHALLPKLPLSDVVDARASVSTAGHSRYRPTQTEALFGLFVAFQVAEFGVLVITEHLELSLAACLSASLVTVACLVARYRTEAADVACNQAVTAAYGSASPKPASAFVQSGAHAPKAAPALIATQAERVAFRLAIAEDSVPWADLMARISHEIRTPLNAVIGFSDLMGREIFGPLGHPRYADYAAHIKESGEALLKSAEDALALSSQLATPVTGQRIQTSNLVGLVEDAWRFLAPIAERRAVTLQCAICNDLDVDGDRRAIRQIVLNLMTEALDRAADGTTIAIQARTVGDIARLEVCAPTTSSRLRESDPSLAICIASALLMQLGAPFSTRDCGAKGAWTATMQLDLAVQADFFQR